MLYFCNKQETLVIVIMIESTYLHSVFIVLNFHSIQIILLFIFYYYYVYRHMFTS